MPALRAGLLAALLLAAAEGSRPQTHYTVEEGKIQAIESNQPVPSLMRAGGPVLGLGPILFNGNVLKASSKDSAEHWIVTFCPSWWGPCQALAEPFEQQAAQWQAKLNDDLMSVRARFGSVDCAVHKVLCNEQGVEDYPTVVHYHRGSRPSRWTGNGKKDASRLAAWLEAELRAVPAAAAMDAKAQAPGAGTGSWRALLAPGLGRDLALVAAVLMVNCWAFLSSGGSEHKEPPASEPAPPRAPARGGVVRCLPRDWAQRRESLVL